MANRRITEVQEIQQLSDTGKIIVNDSEDVKQITKKHLLGQLADSVNVSYDGSAVGIDAQNVQGAITEVENKRKSMYPITYKGTVATYADLPTDPSKGDMYNVTTDETTHQSNINYAWNGSSWDSMGGTTDMNLYYLKTETDNAINDKALTLQSITIPHASVVANTDFLSGTFPYCYDYADASITVDTVIQDIVAQDVSNQTAYDSYCYGANLTGAGTVRIYFITQPTSDMAVTLIRQKGVR